MSTSNQQPRSGRRRQPFGFLNANTLSDTTENSGVGSNSGSNNSSDPVKNVPKKKNMRGIFKSIVTRSKGRKDERSSIAAAEEEEDVSAMEESPTKKTRTTIMTKMDDNDTSKFADSAGITNNINTAFNNFDANDVQHVFRPLVSAVSVDAFCWDDDMEDMLEIKLAKPISDESMSGIIDDTNAERSDVGVDVTNLLTTELDENVNTGEPIFTRHQVEEDRDISTAFILDVNDDDVKPIFRPKYSEVSLDAGMVDLLELKQANPISDESVDEETNTGGSERRVDALNVLSKDLVENDGSTSAGVHILWSTRVKEDKDGFKIHIDPLHNNLSEIHY